GSQRATTARASREPITAIAPAATRALDGRQRREAGGEAFLLHVEIDGAADGGIHVGGRRPAEIAARGLDVGHTHLDILVVLAVILARGDIEDLRGARVVTQYRKLLRDRVGARRRW